MNIISRRGFLTVGALGSLATIIGIHPTYAQFDDASTILNLGASGELYAASIYNAALKSQLDFTDSEQLYLKAIMLSEYDHLGVFQSLGGKALVSEFFVREDMYSDKVGFATTAARLETGIFSAYLTGIRIFTEVQDDELALLMARMAALEAQHQVMMNMMVGGLPNKVSFLPYFQQEIRDIIGGMDNLMVPSSDNSMPIIPPTESEIEVIRAELIENGYDTTPEAQFVRN